MPSSRAISVFEPPDAEANTICARRTNPCGAERDRTHSIRLCRSVSLNTISRMRGRPICSPTMIAGSSMKRHHVQYKLFVGHDTSHYFGIFPLTKRKRLLQCGHRDGGVGEANSRALMARRNSGSVGLGGGALSGRFFPPCCGLEPEVLEIGTCDAGHERVSVQAGPGSALKVVKTEFLLKLLVRLLTDPASLDGCRQTAQRSARREIAEIVFALAAAAPFTDEPDVFTGQVAMTRAARSIGHAHALGCEARGECTFGALPPDHTPPKAFCQHVVGILGGFARHRMLTRLASLRPWEQQVHSCGEDLQRTGNTDRPGEAACAQPLAEWSAIAVSTQPKRTPLALTRSISASAISGLLFAIRAASGTPALAQRAGSSVQTRGRNNRSPTGTGTSPRAKVNVTRH